MALPVVEPKLAALELNPKQRRAKGGDGPYLTDEGNYILDCACGVIDDPEVLAAELQQFGADRLDLSRCQFDRNSALYPAIIHQQFGCEELVVARYRVVLK